MRATKWTLKVDLESFNRDYLSLGSDAKKASFMVGLALGMNDGAIGDTATEALVGGFRFGKAMRDRAVSLRQTMTVNGLKGGRP